MELADGEDISERAIDVQVKNLEEMGRALARAQREAEAIDRANGIRSLVAGLMLLAAAYADGSYAADIRVGRPVNARVCGAASNEHFIRSLRSRVGSDKTRKSDMWNIVLYTRVLRRIY